MDSSIDYYTNYLTNHNNPYYNKLYNITINQTFHKARNILFNICNLIECRYNISLEQFMHTVDFAIKDTIDTYGSVNIQNNDWFLYTPLHLACSCYMKIKPLEEKYNHSASNKFKKSQIEIIIKQQEYLIIQLLLNGADISILSREEYTEFIDESNLPKKRDNIYYSFDKKKYYIQHSGRTPLCMPIQRNIDMDNASKMRSRLLNIIIIRKNAIEFVKLVSNTTGLLPDIANVVFDYSHTFIQSIHYDLAKASFDINI
jgi:hypothetical protein